MPAWWMPMPWVSSGRSSFAAPAGSSASSHSFSTCAFSSSVVNRRHDLRRRATSKHCSRPNTNTIAGTSPACARPLTVSISIFLLNSWTSGTLRSRESTSARGTRRVTSAHWQNFSGWPTDADRITSWTRGSSPMIACSRAQRRRVDRVLAPMKRAKQRGLRHQRLAGAGRDRDEHALAGEDRADRLLLHRIRLEAAAPQELLVELELELAVGRHLPTCTLLRPALQLLRLVNDAAPHVVPLL